MKKSNVQRAVEKLQTKQDALMSEVHALDAAIAALLDAAGEPQKKLSAAKRKPKIAAAAESAA